MAKLLKRYEFDWEALQSVNACNVEYSITDICNNSCALCSHLAPIAKQANFVQLDEFRRVVTIMRKILPSPNTFWLTGGEATMHPQFVELLKILNEIYYDGCIGIYTNGLVLRNYENDEGFWDFVREAGVILAITIYGTSPQYFGDLFKKHGCSNNLAIIRNGELFSNLTNYSYNQTVTKEKFERCQERDKINIRNGKIYNCPMSAYVDLFNAEFNENLQTSTADYLVIDENLTKEQIATFRREPMPFCAQCDLSKRYKKFLKNAKSTKQKDEWSNF